MPLEKILITVKTYPTLSKKYGETVCTAGIRSDGSWIRLYPVPFRRLNEKEQYKKWEWVECNVVKHQKDPRPESYHPTDFSQLVPVDSIDTSNKWQARNELIFNACAVHTSLEHIIEAAKNNEMSLTVFKPAKLTGFDWEEEDPEWSADKLNEMRKQAQQGELFEEENWRKTFKIIPKLPYSFSYKFEDENGKSSKLQILDWEIGALYWNCFNAHRDEEEALEKVKQRYWTEFGAKDLHFFLGTTQQFHFVGPNPWVIIGVYYPPVNPQTELSLND